MKTIKKMGNLKAENLINSDFFPKEIKNRRR